MAIFDNISYGVSPQFSTSPDVVKMDFFSDISSLGGLISAKSSAGASGGSGKDDKYDPMLYNQQVQTGQQRALLDRRKQSFVDNYMAKARELVKKTPGLTMAKAITMLGDDIQTEALQLRMQENDYNANSELHKRNVKFAEADYKNEKKKGQFTLVQHADGQEGFMGYDKSGKITSDEEKIVRPMTNSDYYQKTEKGIQYGEVYNSPIEIDNEKGDAFIRAAMTEAGNNFKTSGGSNEGFVGSKEAQAFKTYFDKSALKTTSWDSKDNASALLNEVEVLKRFIPLESRRALKQEYLAARTNPISRYKKFDEKGNAKFVGLNEMSFEEGFQTYLYDKIISRTGSEHDKMFKQTTNYTLHGDGNGNGNGSGSDENTNWWYNVAMNKRVGAKPALFNNPNAEKNTYISDYGNKLEAFKERRRNAIKKQNKDWTEAQIDDYVNGEKAMQDFETEYKTTGVTFKAIYKSGLLAKEIEKDGLGGIFVSERTPTKWYNEDIYDFVRGKRTYKSDGKNPYKRTSFPVTEEQLNRNYGENVIKYDVEGVNQFSHAGVGASAGGDVYGEGMTKWPETVKKDLITVSTNAVYQGVQRPGGGHSNALAEKRGIIHKDRLAQMKGKLWSDGKSGEYSYDANDYVQATLGVDELTEAEMQDYLDIAKNEKNVNGLSKLNKIKGNESDYVVVTFYEDFQESAENLSMLQANRKDLYPPIQAADNGTVHIKNVPTNNNTNGK